MAEAAEGAQDDERAKRRPLKVPRGAPHDVPLHHLPERLPVERRVLGEEKHDDRRHVQNRRGRVRARARARRRLLGPSPALQLLLLLLLGRDAVVQRAKEREKESVGVGSDHRGPQEARIRLRVTKVAHEAR